MLIKRLSAVLIGLLVSVSLFGQTVISLPSGSILKLPSGATLIIPAVVTVTTPGTPVVLATGPKTALLRWTASTSTAGTIWEYRIWRSAHGAGSYSQVGVSPVTTYGDSSLANSTQYDYQVDAVDEPGNVSSRSSTNTYLTGAQTTLASNGGPDYPTWTQSLINTQFVLPTGGTTWNVTSVGTTACSAGHTLCGLSYAVTNAALGDVISVAVTSTDSGGTYNLNSLSGNALTLPNKTGSGWIYIVSANYGSLPAPHSRVALSDASNMPHFLVATANTGNIGFTVANNANHYRMVGINFDANYTGLVNRPIAIDSGATTLVTQPHDITFDRCIVQAGATYGGIHGIRISASNVAIVDSYFSNWIDRTGGNDSQAIFVDTSVGPIKIDNNYLEGGSENVLWGGSDPTITNVIPADVQVTNNWIIKPLAWLSAPIAAATGKNLLEVKNGERIVIANNRFENFWTAAQNWSISFKSTDQSGACTWCQAVDIAFIGNRLVNISNGMTVHARNGSGTTYVEAVTTRTTIRDNVFEITGLDLSGTYTTTNLSAMLITPDQTVLGDQVDLIYEHNTALIYASTASITAAWEGDCCSGGGGALFTGPYAWAKWQNNIITTGGAYGYKFSRDNLGNDTGTTALDYYFPSLYVATYNAYIGGSGGTNPSNTFSPTNNAAVNFSGGSLASPPTLVSAYALTPSTTYAAGGANQASDGTDMGANISVVTTQ